MEKGHKIKKQVEIKNNHNLNLSLLIILSLIIIGFILFLIFKNFNLPGNNSEEQETYLYKVTEIIDGDTLVIERGNYIRLIGINAPEKNQEYYNESIDFLSNLILNKEVRVEKDLDNADNYGRLLRYIFLKQENGKEILVNIEIVEQGLAKPMFVEPNEKYKQEIETAWKTCLKTSINLCA